MWDSQPKKWEPSPDAALMIGMAFGAFVMFIVMFVLWSSDCDWMEKEFRNKAIETGAAHYDAKTGAFTWKNEVVE